MFWLPQLLCVGIMVKQSLRRAPAILPADKNAGEARTLPPASPSPAQAAALTGSPTALSRGAIDMAQGTAGWGFAISFIGGHGVLSTRDRRVGPLGIKTMALEVPNLSFPFDLSGGAEIFRSRRCLLRQLVLTLDQARLAELVQAANLGAHGLSELRVAICDGFIEMAGVFRVGEHCADFSCRATLLPSGPHTVGLVFYESRFFGWLPVPAALLPVCLQRALRFEPNTCAPLAGAWFMRPVETFAQQIMPRGGWKIPDLRKSHLLSVQVSRGEITLAAGPGEESWEQQLAERPTPPQALRAARGILHFAGAERALAAGAVGEAYQMYRRGAEDPDNGAWARERLLQIGVADSELETETQRLAEETLAGNPDDVTARLTLGALALRRRGYAEAVDHYNSLAELLTGRKERPDVVAAEMAAGRAAAFTDPAAALRAFERAASRAQDSATVQAHIYALHESTADYAQAADAGERWVELIGQAQARATTRCRLAHLYLVRLKDTGRAKRHYEAALREVPHMPEALEGLAEAHIALDEPEQASEFLAAMAQQAETCEDSGRIAQLNMRLGEVARRWLKDPEGAAARYRRVLEVEPRHVQARLRLAQLCEARDDLAQAIELYRGVVLVQDEAVAGDRQDLLTAHLRLAHLYDAQSPDKVAQVAAQLERVLELDPANAEARDKLLAMLRHSGEWAPLVARLEGIVAAQLDVKAVRAARLEAANIELHRLDNLGAARHMIEPLLAAEPAAADALELFAEVCRRQQDFFALSARLTAAVAAVPQADNQARAALLYQLALAQQAQGSDVVVCVQSLESALLLAPDNSAAAINLVALLEKVGDTAALAQAYKQLAATRQDPQLRAEAHLAAAHTLRRIPEQRGAALAAVQAALRAAPQLLDATLLQIDMMAESDPDGALQAVQAALQNVEAAEALPLHSQAAKICEHIGDSVGQVEHLEVLAQASTLSTAEHAAYVDALLTLGQPSRAATLWEDLAARQPEREARAKALLQAAQLHEEGGNLAQAQELLQQVGRLGGTLAVRAGERLETMARHAKDADAVLLALQIQVRQQTDCFAQKAHERLLEQHLQDGDAQAAASVAAKLLEQLPQHALSRHTLAEAAATAGRWEEALDHLVYLTLVSPRDALPAAVRQSAYLSAAGLAEEIRANALPALQEAFFDEFGMPLQATPTGERLEKTEAYGALLALRLFQLNLGEAQAEPALRRQVADLLHHRLQRSDEAEVHYRAVCLAEPRNVDCRVSLAEIYTDQGRDAELAGLHQELCLLAQRVEDAAHHALLSAELCVQRLCDPAAASEALQGLLQREDARQAISRALCGQERNAELLKLPMLLRQLGLHPQLALLLDNSLEQAPSVTDGRFDELYTLLRGPLGEPQRALQLTQNLIGKFPQDDSLRRKVIEVLAQQRLAAEGAEQIQPITGAQEQAYRAWANARQGAQRAAILQELAALHRSVGEAQCAYTALAAAADALPQDQALCAAAIDQALSAELWTEAIFWLWRAIRRPGRQDGPRVAHNDARLLQIVTLATDYQPDPAMVRCALAALSQRDPEQLATLLRLCCAERDFTEILQPQVLQGCSDAQLLQTAQRLAKVPALGPMQTTLETLLARLEGPGGLAEKAWELAQRAFRQAEQLPQLAAWRLQWATRVAEPQARCQQLLAYSELLEAQQAPKDVHSLIHAVLCEVDFAHVAEAKAAFVAAQAIGDAAAVQLAAQALESLLDPLDACTLPVLRVRLQHELQLPVEPQQDGMPPADPEVAVQLARRLLALGDADAAACLEGALERAGHRTELLELLQHRAQSSDEGAPQLWTRIAALHVDGGAYREAAAALSKVLPEARTRRFGELQFTVGCALGDDHWQHVGAELCAQYSVEPAERAAWLRRTAAVLWFKRSESTGAYALLREAQALSPVQLQAMVQAHDAHLQAQPTAHAQRLCELQMALAVLPFAGTAPLYRRLAQTLCPTPPTLAKAPSGKKSRPAVPAATQALATQYLQVATTLACEQTPEELPSIAAEAQAQGAFDLQIACLRHLYGVDAERYFEPLAAALAQAAQWDAVLQHVVQAAQSRSGAAAAALFERAAILCATQRRSEAQTLAYWQQAIDAEPRKARLQSALQVATPTAEHGYVIAWTTALLALLPAPSAPGPSNGSNAPGAPHTSDAPSAPDASDAQRQALLRQRLSAEVAVGNTAAQYSTRRALVAAGCADLDDKRLLAAHCMQSSPKEAAQLWDAIAESLSAASTSGPQKLAWAKALYQAAQAYQRLQEPQKASARLRMALAAGLDDPTAYSLAIEVFEPAARRPIIGRFLALQGDADLPAGRRAQLRLELAQAKAAQGDRMQAVALTRQAFALWPQQEAAACLEALLEQQNDTAGLVALYLKDTDAALWGDRAYLPRLHRSKEFCRQQADAAGELMALTRLAQVSAELRDQALDEEQTALCHGTADCLRMLELYGQAQDHEHFLGLLSELQDRLEAADACLDLARIAAPWCMQMPGGQGLSAAEQLVTEALKKEDDHALLDMLREIYSRQGRPLLFARTLRDRALRHAHEGRTDWARMGEAADLLQGDGAQGEAFALYQQMQAATGCLSDAAMRFCVRFAVREARYEAAVAMLMHQAEHTGDANTAHEQLLVAASIVREKLGDKKREMGLLHAAYVQAPHPALLGRLVESYLHSGDQEAAARLLGEIDLEKHPEAAECFAQVAEQAPEHLSEAMAEALLQHYRRQANYPALAELCLFMAARALAAMRPGHAAYHSEAAQILRDHLKDTPRAAKLFERAGQMDQAYSLYSQLFAAQANTEAGPTLQLALDCGRLGLLTGDVQPAATALAKAFALNPEAPDCRPLYRQALQAAKRYHELAELLKYEADLAERRSDRLRQHEELVELATLYSTQLARPLEACAALEQALQVQPGDVTTLERLMAHYQACGDTRRYLLMAERLLGLPRQSEHSAAFYAQLGKLYQGVDPRRAQTFLAKAAALQQSRANPMGEGAPTREAVQPPQTAPEAPAAQAPQPVGAAEVATLHARLKASPHDYGLMRRLADMHATQPKAWATAAALYAQLLQQQPQDAELLKLLARLYGQAGQTDRAYSYYACLLCVEADDAEAQNFVRACRAARLAARRAILPEPQHLTAAAWARWLQAVESQKPLPQGSAPIEALFAPLSRYAELACAANPLSDAALAKQPLVAADDARLKDMAALLALLPAPQPQVRVAQPGKLCDMHLAPAAPTLLLGQSLFGHVGDVAEASVGLRHGLYFTLVRTVELHRSGHTLCARLPLADLGALSTALCEALYAGPVPTGLPYAARGDTRDWAARMRPLLSPHIRTLMQPRCEQYIEAKAGLDFSGWAATCVQRANRLAMLLCCDVHEATEALLQDQAQEQDQAHEQAQGTDGAAQTQSCCEVAQQRLDLLRFAQSSDYFELRHALGVAL